MTRSSHSRMRGIVKLSLPCKAVRRAIITECPPVAQVYIESTVSHLRSLPMPSGCITASRLASVRSRKCSRNGVSPSAMKRCGSGVSSLAQRLPRSCAIDGDGPGTRGIWMRVRHERMPRVVGCGAALEMRGGPSEPACRRRLQTTSSCRRQERLW